jgi:large repetitive protein
MTNSPSASISIPSEAVSRTNGVSAKVFARSNANSNNVLLHATGEIPLVARAYNPQLSVGANYQVACGIQQVSFSISDYPASPAGFTWYVPSGWTIISGQNSPSIQVQTSQNSAGSLGVNITDNKCGTTYSLQSSISRPIPPTLDAISGGAGCFCAGQTQQYSVPAVNGATSYVWTASGSLSIAGGQGTNTVSVGSSGSGGTISAYAVTPCGNTNTVGSYYISSSSGAPQTPNITVSSTPCTNYRRAGLLTITNSDPCATYYWSASPSVIISGGNPNASVEVASGGNYAYVYGVNACGSSGTGSRVIPIDTQCFGPLRLAQQDTLGVGAAPNPFSSQTTISYTLPEEGTVRLDVVSPVRGVIATLAEGKKEAGKHDQTFDASRFPSGVYTARLTFNPKGSTKPQQTSCQLIVQR